MAKEIRKPCHICRMVDKENARWIFKLARTMFPKAHYTVVMHIEKDNIKLYTITFDLYLHQYLKLLSEYRKREKEKQHE